LLLGADNPYDFLTRYRFLSQIAKEDALLLKSVQEEVENVRTWREELDKREKDIKTTRDELLAQQKSLAYKKDERNRILAQTVSQREEYERALRELEESSRVLESLIRRLQETTQGPGLIGSLFWPADSHLITSPFGWRNHPIFGTRMFHTGVDIAGNYGDNIYAVNEGRVIYSGWQSGYGKVIIVDHGNGMSTVYAHCSQLLVNVGDVVKRGEVIGKIGATGWATGPHLHFEIRRNGTPIDPLSVIK
ncbi:MAG: murein hydrolase activator EnvC family protein, partial [bacterium]